MRAPGSGFPQPHKSRDGRDDEDRCRQRSQGDERYAVGEVFRAAGSGGGSSKRTLPAQRVRRAIGEIRLDYAPILLYARDLIWIQAPPVSSKVLRDTRLEAISGIVGNTWAHSRGAARHRL
jgi:hypothetical protein